MDKKTSEQLPIKNVADYIDALTRPKSEDLVVRKTVIAGRRMRDKFREQTVITEVVKKLS